VPAFGGADDRVADVGVDVVSQDGIAQAQAEGVAGDPVEGLGRRDALQGVGVEREAVQNGITDRGRFLADSLTDALTY
jgi:hypothetical protein